MSISHLIILVIIAVIVIPPDKLPEVARQVARFFNDIRRSTSGVWDDLKKDAMVKPEDFLKHRQQQNQPQPASTSQSNPTAPTQPVEEKKHES